MNARCNAHTNLTLSLGAFITHAQQSKNAFEHKTAFTHLASRSLLGAVANVCSLMFQQKVTHDPPSIMSCQVDNNNISSLSLAVTADHFHITK